MSPIPDPIERPNGKMYRPRKGLERISYYDETDDGDIEWHLAVLRTHDIDTAKAFLIGNLSAYGRRKAQLRNPRPGWLRKTIGLGSEEFWLDNETEGVPCVIFDEDEEYY